MNTPNQKSLARFLGISPQYLSDIKTGKKTLGKKTAIRISKITGLTFQDLVFLKGDEFLRKTRLAMMAAMSAPPRKNKQRRTTP